MNNYWKGKKCLVTGGNGFLGKKLVKKLIELDADVVTFSSKEFDLRDFRQSFDIFEYSQPEIVFHLAATVGGIGATNKYAGKYFIDNALMGINVVELCHILSVSKLVVAGSVCEYPWHTSIPMREIELWNGKPEETNAPYGIAKRSILAMQQAYMKQYGLDSAHILQANLYGPGDDFSDETSHVIPALIKRFLHAHKNNIDEVVIWGTGNPTRDFLYAEDAVEAYLLAAQYPTDPMNPINIGTGTGTSIKDVVVMISR